MNSLKNTLLFFLGLALLVSTAAIPAAYSAISPVQTEDALTLKDRALLAAMEKGDFQATVRDFDATMLKVMGPEKMEQM